MRLQGYLQLRDEQVDVDALLPEVTCLNMGDARHPILAHLTEFIDRNAPDPTRLGAWVTSALHMLVRYPDDRAEWKRQWLSPQLPDKDILLLRTLLVALVLRDYSVHDAFAREPLVHAALAACPEAATQLENMLRTTLLPQNRDARHMRLVKVAWQALSCCDAARAARLIKQLVATADDANKRALIQLVRSNHVRLEPDVRAGVLAEERRSE